MVSYVFTVDVLLVYGRTSKEHWSRVRLVLDRIQSSGMTLKRKCEFEDSVKFLGHVVSGDGIHPDPNKVKAISEMNLPTGKKPEGSWV